MSILVTKIYHFRFLQWWVGGVFLQLIFIQSTTMADKSKVPIEMKPYNAITILAFCREFFNDETFLEYKYQAIKEAVDELELQLGKNLTEEQFEEIKIEDEVNQLIGKSPLSKL